MREILRSASVDDINHHVQILTDLVGNTRVINAAQRLGLRRALYHSWERLSRFQEDSHPETFSNDWTRCSALVLACWIPIIQRHTLGIERTSSVSIGWETSGSPELVDNFVVERTLSKQRYSLAIWQGRILGIDLSAYIEKGKIHDEFRMEFYRGKIIRINYGEYRQIPSPSSSAGQGVDLRLSHELNLGHTH